MAVKEWSENIVLGEMQDDPGFSEDMNLLEEMLETRPGCHCVLDLSEVRFLNSSNIAKLLKIRKLVQGTPPGRLKLCGIATSVWGVFLVTGLDKIFEFCDNVASGLASVQIEGGDLD
jgi:anti-sigma B factor antagonist